MRQKASMFDRTPCWRCSSEARRYISVLRDIKKLTNRLVLTDTFQTFNRLALVTNDLKTPFQAKDLINLQQNSFRKCFISTVTEHEHKRKPYC